jgi:RNA polymerase sigma-70 factor (ECF subfamily)
VDVDVDDAHYIDTDSELRDLESPESALYRDELERVVKSTLDRLPEDLRVALTLREFEGMSYEDIANVMDCPVGTVRSRIFRAREAIDKEIAPLLAN